MVNRDGSGTLTVIVAVDREVQELLLASGQEVKEIAEALPPEFETTEYVDGELEGIRSAVQFADIDELNALLGTELGGGQVVDGASIVRDGDTFVFHASLGDLREQFAAGAGAGAVLSEEVYDDVFDISISVQLPGELIEHNADEIGLDGEARWLITSDSIGELSATSSVASGLSLPLLMVAVAGVGALGLGGALLFSRSQSLASTPSR